MKEAESGEQPSRGLFKYIITILTLSTVFPHTGQEQGPASHVRAPFFTVGTGLEKCTPVGIQSSPSDGASQVPETPAPTELSVIVLVTQAPAKSSGTFW